MYKNQAWRDRKKKFFSVYKKICACCGSQPHQGPIQLHHLNYDHPIGAEPDESLTPLCKDCHIKVHIFATENADFYNLEESTVIYIRMVEYGGNPLRIPRKLSQRRKGKGKTIKKRRRKTEPYNNYAKTSRARKSRKQRRVPVQMR